jgi:hypothetical protein
MYLTLLSIAEDLSSFQYRATGKDFTPYSHFAIMHRLYNGSGIGELETSGINGSANWTNLLSSTGLKLEVPVTDGVHRFNFLLGKTQAGATIDVAGVLSFGTGVDTTTLDYVALSTDPYVLYSYDKVTKVVTGMAGLSNVSLILYTQDLNHSLVMVTAERALAKSLREIAHKGCDAIKTNMARYVELLSAMARFKCGDYQGADALVGADSITVNCGCS